MISTADISAAFRGIGNVIKLSSERFHELGKAAQSIGIPVAGRLSYAADMSRI